jgi:septum site-determining protein MinD
MGRIIAFLSGKGGTGKSTVVCNLGAALAAMGKHTMIVDTDLTMADVGLMLGLHDKKVTLHEVLAGKAKPEKAVYQSFYDLRVVPCGLSLAGVESIRLDRVRDVIKKLAKNQDFVLLDCPSGFGEDTLASLRAAEEAVLVLNPDFASVSNALNTKTIAQQLGLKVRGAILNRVQRGALPTRRVALTLGLPILAEIPEDPEIPRATAVGEPVLVFAPRSRSSRAFKKLANVIARVD